MGTNHNITDLIDQYAAGPKKLRDIIAGITDEWIDATPVSGQWSTRQVICHLADYEAVYADRMKRVIAKEQPTFNDEYHQKYADHLVYTKRDIKVELNLIEVTRAQMTHILRLLPTGAFERTGIHSVDGVMTLATLLERITKHIPHHSHFIEEKKRAIEESLPCNKIPDALDGSVLLLPDVQLKPINNSHFIGISERSLLPTPEENNEYQLQLDCSYRKFLESLTEASGQMKDQHYFSVSISGRDNEKSKERVYSYELYHQLRKSLGDDFQFKLDGELDKGDHPEFKKKMKPDFVVHVPGKHEEGMNLVVVEVKDFSSFKNLKEEDFFDQKRNNSVYNLTYCVDKAHYYRGILLVFSSEYANLSSHNVHEKIATIKRVSAKCNNQIECYWHNGPTGSLNKLVESVDATND